MAARYRFAAILGLGVSAFFLLSETGVDPDLFWHLRVAESIAQSGPAPIQDDLSYYSSLSPWLPYSWLAELLMLHAVRGIGTAALILIPLLCYTLTLLFLGISVLQRTGPTVKAGFVLMAAALVIQPFIGLRPATIAYPLLALAALIALDQRRDRVRLAALFGVVPLTALIANIHLFFLFPPLLLYARALGDALASRGADPSPRRTALLTTLAGTASLAAALLANPFGLQLLDPIVHYLRDDIMVASGHIIEMQPFYRLGPTVALGVGVIAAWTLAGFIPRRHRRTERGDLLFLALALILLGSLGRYVPLAVLLLAPLAASHAPVRELPSETRRLLSAVGAGSVVGLVVVAGQRWIAHPPEGTLLDYAEARSRLPVAAALFVRDSLPPPTAQGRLLNEMGWGGFLVYTLAPRYRVMLDGRTQVYPDYVWEATYARASRASRLRLLQAARGDVALFPARSEWASIVEDDMGWLRIYGDSLAGVWIRPNSGDGSLLGLDASPTGS